MKKLISSLLALAIALLSCATLASCGGSDEASTGLTYELNEAGDAYTVVSIGRCRDAKVILPAEYKGLPVTAIGEYAFKGSSISKITVTENIVSIAGNAFENCVNIIYNTHETLSYIGTAKNPYYALLVAPQNSKETFSLHKNTKIIADYAMYDCSIKALAIPEGVTHIGMGAFGSCGAMELVSIPESVVIIADEAFANCASLKAIVLPASLTHLGDSAFMYCMKLKEISFNGTAEEWGKVSSDGWNRYFDDEISITFKD